MLDLGNAHRIEDLSLPTSLERVCGPPPSKRHGIWSPAPHALKPSNSKDLLIAEGRPCIGFVALSKPSNMSLLLVDAKPA